MTNERERATLCPECRKLIPRNSITCPVCKADLIRPGNQKRNEGEGQGTGYGAGYESGPGGNPDTDPATRLFTSLQVFSIRAVIRAVIGINVLFFAICLFLYPPDLNLASPMNALSPDGRSLLLLGASGTYPIDKFGRWWTLLSAGWLHGSLLHIVFNMLAFHRLGTMISQLFGLSRMIIIYTLTGIFGFAASWASGVQFTIGASASVCGLVGAALYFGKHRGGQLGQAVFQNSFGWVIGLALIGMMPNINNWGHGGGLLSGILIAALLGYKEGRPVSGTDLTLAVVCILITGLILFWALFSGLLQYFI